MMILVCFKILMSFIPVLYIGFHLIEIISRVVVENTNTLKMVNGIIAMSRSKKILEIFKYHPEKWAYKGDEIIWDELEAQLQLDIFPASVEDFTDKIETLFKTITGVPITEQECVNTEKQKYSGLSNIQISPRFWQDKALPLLQVRYIITELRHSKD